MLLTSILSLVDIALRVLSSVGTALTELTMDSSESLSYHCFVSTKCQVPIQEWFVISSGTIQPNVDINFTLNLNII